MMNRMCLFGGRRCCEVAWPPNNCSPLAHPDHASYLCSRSSRRNTLRSRRCSCRGLCKSQAPCWRSGRRGGPTSCRRRAGSAPPSSPSLWQTPCTWHPQTLLVEWSEWGRRGESRPHAAADSPLSHEGDSQLPGPWIVWKSKTPLNSLALHATPAAPTVDAIP